MPLCTHCSHRVSVASKFCGNCGAAMGAASKPSVSVAGSSRLRHGNENTSLGILPRVPSGRRRSDGANVFGGALCSVPERTVDALHPVSRKGAAILSDMRDLADDAFDGRLDVPQSVTVPRSGPLAHPPAVGLADRIGGAQGWRTGRGTSEVVSLSDRNLLALDVAVDGSHAVVACANHSAYVVTVGSQSGAPPLNAKHPGAGRGHPLAKKVELFGKGVGHTDWVTATLALPKEVCGRASSCAITGGQDGALWCWLGIDTASVMTSATAVACAGHRAGVSKITCPGVHAVARGAPPAHSLVASGGYDRHVLLWDVADVSQAPRGARGALRQITPVADLSRHKAPVMELLWEAETLVSGDRDGVILHWDPHAQRPTATFCPTTRCGHVTALGLLGDGSSIAGYQDGAVRCWDQRQPQATSSVVAHPGGAVNAVAVIDGQNLIVTAGADRVLKWLDPRRDLCAVGSAAHHQDFIYSTSLAWLPSGGLPLVLSGGGDGNVLVHDSSTFQCLYGFGATRGAVRGLRAVGNSLVCAGDDGTVLQWNFEQ